MGKKTVATISLFAEYMVWTYWLWRSLIEFEYSYDDLGTCHTQHTISLLQGWIGFSSFTTNGCDREYYWADLICDMATGAELASR